MGDPLEQDFSMDLPAEQVAEQVPPVVIVQQSAHGWLTATLPPSLILLGALAITSHQLRPDPRAYAPASEPERATAVVQVNPTAEIALPEVELHAATPDQAAPAPVQASQPAGEVAKLWGIPGELALTAIPGVPSAAPPADMNSAVDPPLSPDAAEPPLVSDEDGKGAGDDLASSKPDDRGAQIVWDDIEAEAQANRREKEAAEALRGEAFAKSQADAIARVDRARLAAANDRGQFVQDLTTLLRRHGSKAGPHISQLVILYGRDAPQELMDRAEDLNRRMAAARVPVDQRISALRTLGLPETCILDGLARLLEPSIGTRRGPRNAQEVMYHAALRLVKVPLATPSPPEPGINSANP